MSLDRLLAQLDADPNKRGREFERICRWYLTSAPQYRRRFQHVWLWRDWPGMRAPDRGIDLVAEEHGGDLWAIQAKAYAPDYAIKKKDVDSFLAEAGRPDFSYRLLIATTDHLGPAAKSTLDEQREPVGYLLRSQLELAPVAWPQSPDDLRPRRPPRKKPFPHVKEAIRATVRGFNGNDRGQLIMACGTGKTLAAMWISERLDAKRTLILLPSLSLLAQTLREWSANASKPFDYLAVCSDASVAGEDDFLQHTSKLGLPVTTDPERIAAFLRRRGRRVVFATYQSSPQIAAALEGRVPTFDLAVADEAHRCAGRVGTEFTTILDSDQIRSKRRLFMTATPRFYTPRLRSEAGVLDVEVASMDDEAAFGPVFHRLSFGEAIERDLLSDYQVVVVGVTDSMYRGQKWAESRRKRISPAVDRRSGRKPKPAWGSHNRSTRAGSSAGQSSGLIIRRSVVRVHPGPSKAPLARGFRMSGQKMCLQCASAGEDRLPSEEGYAGPPQRHSAGASKSCERRCGSSRASDLLP